MPKLNLGCGQARKEGYINLDKIDYGQEIVRDVLKGLPFDNDKFDEVYSSHCLEHIAVGDDLRFVMEEIWRVLKKDSIVFIQVPHSHCDEAFYPDHKSYWNEKMLDALINDSEQKGKYSFEILENKKQGNELHIELKVVK